MSKQEETRFAEILSGFFYDIFRAAGLTMIQTKGHEQVRDISRKLGKTIEFRATKKSVEVVKLLQEAVSAGFDVVSAERDELKHELDTVKEEVHKLKQAMSLLISNQKKSHNF
jgi:gas vesicle protein